MNSRQFIRVFLILLVSVTLLPLSVYFLMRISTAFLPEDYAKKVFLFLSETVHGPVIMQQKEMSSDEQQTQKDAQFIFAWISSCLKQQGITNTSEEFRDIIYLNNNDGTRQAAALPPLLVRTEMLNTKLYTQRRAIEAELSEAYMVAQIGIISSIVLGFLTTVFVGLSSTEFGKDSPRLSGTIKLVAFILPALGTAVAAIIAFYDPSGNLARQSQAVSGLQQLHAQIASGVWKIKCPVGDKVDRDDSAKIDAWFVRMQELMSSVGDRRAQAAQTMEQPNKAGASSGK